MKFCSPAPQLERLLEQVGSGHLQDVCGQLQQELRPPRNDARQQLISARSGSPLPLSDA